MDVSQQRAKSPLSRLIATNALLQGVDLVDGASSHHEAPPQPTTVTIAPREADSTSTIACQERVEAIIAHHKVNPLIAEVLGRRGMVPGLELETFLHPNREALPQPMALRGMKRALEILTGAVRTHKKIAIYHDYDVDGTQAATIIARTCDAVKLSHKEFSPDRWLHGYGLNREIVQRIAKKDFKILVVVDCGTTNHEAVALARKLGMKVIVVDHHALKGKAPSADAFINPQSPRCGYANGDLCAAALAWCVARGLKNKLSKSATRKLRDKGSRIDCDELLGYAALATVADVVPLRGINRILVREGLKELAHNRRKGIVQLLNYCGIKGEIRASDVAFKIAPRINAMGRMIEESAEGVSGASLVMKLMLANRRKPAEELAQRHNTTNQLRQECEWKMVLEAEDMMHHLSRLPDGIVLWSPKFHEGVVGLGASRIGERYYRPTMVLRVRDDGTAKGSVRGTVKGFSVIEALRALHAGLGGDVVLEFGGHEGAGGIKLNANFLPLVREAWDKICGVQLDKLERTPIIRDAIELTLADFRTYGAALVNDLELLEPTGAHNPPARFVARGVRVISAKVIRGRHLEVMLHQQHPVTGTDAYASAILWHRVEHPALTVGTSTAAPTTSARPVPPQRDTLIDVAFTPMVDQKNRHAPSKASVFAQIIAAQKI